MIHTGINVLNVNTVFVIREYFPGTVQIVNKHSVYNQLMRESTRGHVIVQWLAHVSDTYTSGPRSIPVRVYLM